MGSPASIGQRLGRLLGRLTGTAPARMPAVPGAAEPPADRSPAPQTTVPAPPQYAWAEEVHEGQMAALPSADVLDLALVGDSLAQVWPLGTWAPWRAFSLGVGGDRTQHILWRLDRLDWGTCRPRRILVVAGTNNLLAGDAAPDIAAGIEAIASRLSGRHPAAELFVLLPPPFGVDLRGGVAEKRALKARLASRFGPRLIDADAAMTADGPEGNPNYQDDRVHFTDRGYDVLAGVVRAACRASS